MEPHWGDRSKAISTFLGGIAQGHLHLQHPNQRCAPRKKQSFENWKNLWGKVDSNPLKFRRQLQQRNPNFPINICLTLSLLSKSVDVKIKNFPQSGLEAARINFVPRTSLIQKPLILRQVSQELLPEESACNIVDIGAHGGDTSLPLTLVARLVLSTTSPPSVVFSYL